MGLFFYRESPLINVSDGFEYVNGWPNTIENVNYPNTFSFASPVATGTEDFESGW
jgi:hypothetical protein